jgi:PAS domain-containing protein
MHRFARTGVSSRQLAGPGCVHGRRANGEIFQVEASISQIEVAGNRRFTVILRDISKRVRDEQALRESEERLALFAATTFEGIVISERGRILDCNEQVARMRAIRSGGGQLIGELVVPGRPRTGSENTGAAGAIIVEHAMPREARCAHHRRALRQDAQAGLPGVAPATTVRDISDARSSRRGEESQAT